MEKSAKSQIKRNFSFRFTSALPATDFKPFRGCVTEVYQCLRHEDPFVGFTDSKISITIDHQNTIIGGGGNPFIFIIVFHKDRIYGGLVYVESHIVFGQAIYKVNSNETLGSLLTHGANWTFFKESIADHNNGKIIYRYRKIKIQW